MALSNEQLEQIVSSLSPEDRERLFSHLSQQVAQDKRNAPAPNKSSKHSENQKINNKNGIYACIYCGSVRIKGHGTTSAGNQRFICKDCNRTFTENYGSSIRYTHISKEKWLILLRGFVNNHSDPVVARDADLAVSTVWLCKQKVCNAIKEMYGYNELFNGIGEADEFYCIAAFKGKRDPAFFIYTLRRMPRHNRNREEKIEWLKKAGLYDRLQAEEPDYLEELLSDKQKKKRGISNDQICILTLVDEHNNLYV